MHDVFCEIQSAASLQMNPNQQKNRHLLISQNLTKRELALLWIKRDIARKTCFTMIKKR
jgi:hypothetical protein